MTKKQKIVVISSITTAVVLGFLAVAVIVKMRSFMHSPLGPSLGYPTQSAPIVKNKNHARRIRSIRLAYAPSHCASRYRRTFMRWAEGDEHPRYWK